MKKYLFAATMLAAAVSSPAFADGGNRSTDTEVFNLRGNNPAKCNLEAANGQTHNIGANLISDDDGFARNDVSDSVANALDGAGVTAWCTGNNNKLQMYRTAFTTDTGIKGGLLNDDFNRAVIYDIEMTVTGATRADGEPNPIEGTSDGQGRGPGVGGTEYVSRFGPSGLGAAVSFDAESASNATTDGITGAAGERTLFPSDGNRLIAGLYRSTVTIELTPGV